MTTSIRKDIRNGWKAETRFDMPEIGERYFLQVETSKRYNGGVSTTATVNKRTLDGMGYQHQMGLGGGGDFYWTCINDKSARCTEKTVATQHMTALANIEQIKADAMTHYGARVAA
jgi:hypothetical protein